MKINDPATIEYIEFYLDPVKHPKAYNAKFKELSESGLTEDEIKVQLDKTSFIMEVYYSGNNGLFMLESEFLDSNEPFDPYTGVKLERE